MSLSHLLIAQICFNVAMLIAIVWIARAPRRRNSQSISRVAALVRSLATRLDERPVAKPVEVAVTKPPQEPAPSAVQPHLQELVQRAERAESAAERQLRERLEKFKGAPSKPRKKARKRASAS